MFRDLPFPHFHMQIVTPEFVTFMLPIRKFSAPVRGQEVIMLTDIFRGFPHFLPHLSDSLFPNHPAIEFYII
jgi:hypothetical protein